ncbi:lipopolysaccharide kinase InaA family protein [Salegentibacter salegens]|uniref:Lipopolysaccharide kinase (Kdo/WaaP) family protein n=1 Tax=Salegentibacter salegens TaxID=143223 RepID=A0A1M7NX16_9FLAO|nr:lipopolysaccharide kinase InaA family protein [Salegentibacter salegens]PRX45750.1 lipopolysaccharide kinase (Kdo/WaaP) family protein [Salegentibacter salegens]SHN08327.1 Lipopolysaccharide kinase (Kdo/WaaP) family protein [Salegentibacter salegens]
MKIITSENYRHLRADIKNLIQNFNETGDMLVDGKRNKLKLFELEGIKINVKSFKIPNTVNKIAYRFFRKSKAERSFKYAEYLLSKNVGTPQPIAYVEETVAFSFLRSFYLSEQLDYDLSFREIDLSKPGHEAILKAFTRFIFELHEKEIEFLDNSPGNTLIRLNGGKPKFFLVDLNRMNFKALNFSERMRNFSRLTQDKEVVRIMAIEYAKHINKNKDEVFEKMWFYIKKFQEGFLRKKAFKKKFKL